MRDSTDASRLGAGAPRLPALCGLPGCDGRGRVQEYGLRCGGERTLVVDLEEPATPLDVPGARVVKVDGPRQWLRFRRGEANAGELTAAVARQARLIDLTIEETDIEGRRATDLHVGADG